MRLSSPNGPSPSARFHDSAVRKSPLQRKPNRSSWGFPASRKNLDIFCLPRVGAVRTVGGQFVSFPAVGTGYSGQMSTSVVRRWVRCVAAWAWPLVACVLLAPASARASCGDYVIVNGRQPNLAGHHGAMAAEPGRSEHGPGPAQPCSGPTCSARPQAPLSPIPSYPPPSSQEWGTISEPLVLLPPTPTARLAGDPLLLTSIGKRAIFHPPRFSA